MPLRRTRLAGTSCGGEARAKTPRGGPVACRGDQDRGGTTPEGVGPPVDPGGAGRVGGACAPKVPDEALGRVVVVGGDRCRRPQQCGGARTSTAHRRETEVVLGIKDEPWGGPDGAPGERGPNGEDARNLLPGTRQPGTPRTGEPLPVRTRSTRPELTAEDVVSNESTSMRYRRAHW